MDGTKAMGLSRETETMLGTKITTDQHGRRALNKEAMITSEGSFDAAET